MYLFFVCAPNPSSGQIVMVHGFGISYYMNRAGSSSKGCSKQFGATNGFTKGFVHCSALVHVRP